MARLQILELPEGTDDDRPPFVLVVDQADEATVNALSPSSEGLSPYSAVVQKLTGQSAAEQIGARGILVFADTIDIPANEVTLDENGQPLFLKVHVQGEFEQFRTDVQDEIRKAQDELTRAINGDGIAESSGPKCQYCGADCSDGRSWDGGDLYACPICADWRAKLNHHKTALLDALGMDRLRDWDDIRNTAAGMRKERDIKAAALERVRGLPDEPELMDSQHSDPVGYLHGYRVAINAAHRATWGLAQEAEPGE